MDQPTKLLVQMSGTPGSGKSTVANLLAQSINGVVVNHDLIRSFFLDNGNAFAESAKLAYSLQWVLAGDLLRQGRSAIVDSTCYHKETLDQGIALAGCCGCDYKYIECRVNDVGLLERRLHDRVPLRSQRTGINNPPPDASGGHRTEDSLALFKRWIEDPVRPASNAIVVDSTSSPEDCLDYVLKQLASPTSE